MATVVTPVGQVITGVTDRVLLDYYTAEGYEIRPDEAPAVPVVESIEVLGQAADAASVAGADLGEATDAITAVFGEDPDKS